MTYILTQLGLMNSAKLLSNALGIPATNIPGKTAPIIRWGNSNGLYTKDTVYNSPEKIQISGSKRSFSGVLYNNNIPHVHYYKGEMPEQYPVVVRTIENGHGGEGIVICNNIVEFTPYKHCMWSYWRKFSFELGVHVLGGNIARVFKKVWTDENTPEPENPIRNLEKGYGFKIISTESLGKYPVLSKLPAAVKEFYEMFPINLCRLDIAWDSTEHKFVIIECNSAPALSNNVNTLQVYVDYLKNVVGV